MSYWWNSFRVAGAAISRGWLGGVDLFELDETPDAFAWQCVAGAAFLLLYSAGISWSAQTVGSQALIDVCVWNFVFQWCNLRIACNAGWHTSIYFNVWHCVDMQQTLEASAAATTTKTTRSTRTRTRTEQGLVVLLSCLLRCFSLLPAFAFALLCLGWKFEGSRSKVWRYAFLLPGYCPPHCLFATALLWICVPSLWGLPSVYII